MSVEWDIKCYPPLSEEEAATRLRSEGQNELPSAHKATFWATAWTVVREPMLLLLVACGSIYFALGEPQEGVMLLAFVFVVMGISIYQERKTERALEALRDMSSPRALVIRDGVEKRIAGRDVARGDIMILAEGDRVPADAVLLSGHYLEVDESLLTGESVPVRKLQLRADADEAESLLYSGTLVVKGKGIAHVRATGLGTALGRIGKALQEIGQEPTRLHRETARMVSLFATGGLVLCVIVVAGYGLTRGHWLDGFLAGLTLAMAILPEEFPVVLSIFLALGAWRMAQKQVLTRRVPAVEALGAATVLCVDKTGTLTQNRMSVRKIIVRDHVFDMEAETPEELPEALHEIVEYSILASQIDPFDPMEKAFKAFGQRYLANTEHLHTNWILEQEYPLSQELLAMSHVWRTPDRAQHMIAAKGAPEAIADLCHFDAQKTEELGAHVAMLAREGLRVLAVARAEFRAAEMPEIQHAFHFRFLGLIGLSDPVRPMVAEAISDCNAAGVRIVMITGDYPDTARAIGREIGLPSPEHVITGPELELMSDAELAERMQQVHVYARVVPEQKLRLVNALKANGEIVAMTGDGVNDAPALKAAHIGIAMGERGTDVAREAADLVLLDDDFSSIVQAVRLGRRIFDNLQKAIAYIVAVHIPIAGLSLLAVLFGLPLILTPIHVVFLELIIDPACSVVFEAEAEETNVMRRPPRKPHERLFHRRLLGLSVLQGLCVLAIVTAVLLFSYLRTQQVEEARALTFTALIAANLCLIWTNRSWTRTVFQIGGRNRALWWVMGGTVLFLMAALYLPGFRSLFGFSLMHPADVAVSTLAGIVSILWFEFLKYVRRGNDTSGSIAS